MKIKDITTGGTYKYAPRSRGTGLKVEVVETGITLGYQGGPKSGVRIKYADHGHIDRVPAAHIQEWTEDDERRLQERIQARAFVAERQARAEKIVAGKGIDLEAGWRGARVRVDSGGDRVDIKVDWDEFLTLMGEKT